MTENTAMIVEEDIATILQRIDDWHSFSGQVILVTGAAGFIGNYLVRTLLALNERQILESPVKVLAGVRDLDRAQRRFSDLAGNTHLDLVAMDLSAPELSPLPTTDYVIHAASQASPKYYGSDPVGTMLPNIVGTAALLRAAGSGLKGFLFVSSSEVYGSAGRDGEPLVEAAAGVVDPVNPRSCYAEGKRAGETLCVAWHLQLGVPTYIVRPFHTYGPGLTEDDGRVFADFVYNAVHGEDILIRGDGKACRAYCYITDAITAFFIILLRGNPGEAYNVGNPDAELSVVELARLIAGAQPQVKLEVTMAASPSSAGYLKSTIDRLVPDVTRLSELGWTPSVDPTTGFKRTIDASFNS